MKLTGKVAIVTGAGRGVGRSIGTLFAAEGAKVVIVDIDPNGGNETVALIKQAGGEALFVQVDICRAPDCQRMVAAAVSTYGGLDILVNNAGVASGRSRLTEQSEEEWNRIININLKGVFLCSKYAIPEMLRRGRGAIVNISSCSGIVPDYGQAAYCASKAGVIMLTKVTALEYARKNIRVNCVAPGVIRTPMILEQAALTAKDKGVSECEETEKLWADLIKAHPMGRVGDPSEVANAVLFLAVSDASFVTGSVLSVDGGLAL